MKDVSREAARDWWRTDLIEVEPGKIAMRGYPIEQLIGAVSFPEMIWLMTRGELPSQEQARLLEAVLVAGVDHGPHAPSIAIARMAITCGVGINNAMGSAVNVMGDVHGGAGEQLMELMVDIDRRIAAGEARGAVVADEVDRYRGTVTRYVPGFGHRFHPRDPREPKLFALTRKGVDDGVIDGRFLAIADAIQVHLAERTGRHVTTNIDGSGAVIIAELGFEPKLARGLFVLSRSVGILAHAWEQHQQGGRNKGPIPKDFFYTYSGPALRDLEPR